MKLLTALLFVGVFALAASEDTCLQWAQSSLNTATIFSDIVTKYEQTGDHVQAVCGQNAQFCGDHSKATVFVAYILNHLRTHGGPASENGRVAVDDIRARASQTDLDSWQSGNRGQISKAKQHAEGTASRFNKAKQFEKLNDKEGKGLQENVASFCDNNMACLGLSNAVFSCFQKNPDDLHCFQAAICNEAFGDFNIADTGVNDKVDFIKAQVETLGTVYNTLHGLTSKAIDSYISFLIRAHNKKLTKKWLQSERAVLAHNEAQLKKALDQLTDMSEFREESLSLVATRLGELKQLHETKMFEQKEAEQQAAEKLEALEQQARQASSDFDALSAELKKCNDALGPDARAAMQHIDALVSQIEALQSNILKMKKKMAASRQTFQNRKAAGMKELEGHKTELEAVNDKIESTKNALKAQFTKLKALYAAVSDLFNLVKDKPAETIAPTVVEQVRQAEAAGKKIKKAKVIKKKGGITIDGEEAFFLETAQDGEVEPQDLLSWASIEFGSGSSSADSAPLESHIKNIKHNINQVKRGILGQKHWMVKASRARDAMKKKMNKIEQSTQSFQDANLQLAKHIVQLSKDINNIEHVLDTLNAKAEDLQVQWADEMNQFEDSFLGSVTALASIANHQAAVSAWIDRLGHSSTEQSDKVRQCTAVRAKIQDWKTKHVDLLARKMDEVQAVKSKLQEATDAIYSAIKQLKNQLGDARQAILSQTTALKGHLEVFAQRQSSLTTAFSQLRQLIERLVGEGLQQEAKQELDRCAELSSFGAQTDCYKEAFKNFLIDPVSASSQATTPDRARAIEAAASQVDMEAIKQQWSSSNVATLADSNAESALLSQTNINYLNQARQQYDSQFNAFNQAVLNVADVNDEDTSVELDGLDVKRIAGAIKPDMPEWQVGDDEVAHRKKIVGELTDDDWNKGFDIVDKDDEPCMSITREKAEGTNTAKFHTVKFELKEECEIVAVSLGCEDKVVRLFVLDAKKPLADINELACVNWLQFRPRAVALTRASNGDYQKDSKQVKISLNGFGEKKKVPVFDPAALNEISEEFPLSVQLAGHQDKRAKDCIHVHRKSTAGKDLRILPQKMAGCPENYIINVKCNGRTTRRRVEAGISYTAKRYPWYPNVCSWYAGEEVVVDAAPATSSGADATVDNAWTKKIGVLYFK